MKTIRTVLLLSAFPLSSCAMQQGDFPSLQKRPFEEAATSTDPLPPPVPVSSLPGPLQEAVSNALQQSSTAHAKFLRNLPGVKSSVNAASGAAVSSEAWVVAQMELAALEIDRSPSVEALADMDDLYIARLDAEFEDSDPGGAEMIAERREQISAQVKRQQDEIDRIKSQLR